MGLRRCWQRVGELWAGKYREQRLGEKEAEERNEGNGLFLSLCEPALPEALEQLAYAPSILSLSLFRPLALSLSRSHSFSLFRSLPSSPSLPPSLCAAGGVGGALRAVGAVCSTCRHCML